MTFCESDLGVLPTHDCSTLRSRDFFLLLFMCLMTLCLFWPDTLSRSLFIVVNGRGSELGFFVPNRSKRSHFHMCSFIISVPMYSELESKL
jgi:hypothetical protein